jgi:hypothetical protein
MIVLIIVVLAYKKRVIRVPIITELLLLNKKIKHLENKEIQNYK